MTDDYQYQSTVLPAKNEGLFGLGGKPNEGSRGFGGSIVDGGSGANGANGDPGLQGVQGIQGPPGESGLLVDGKAGDMLYHNGYEWVTFNGVEDTSILKMQSRIPRWRPGPRGAGIVYQTDTEDLEALAGFTYGDMLFWDTNNWSIIPAASGEGTFVLASNGGTPYWIETESCDTQP
jgi:hypothetical protein